MSHTAGEWVVAGPWPNVSVGIDDPSKDDYTTNYRGFIPIAFMAEDTTTEDVMDHADARLIAAAPLLLASLEEMFQLVQDGVLVRDITRDADASWSMAMLKLVRTLNGAQVALAKAKGQP